MSYSTITCHEEHGTRDEKIGPDGFECSVTLRVAYADRYSLVEDLLINERLWPHFNALVAPTASSAVIENVGLEDNGDPTNGVMQYSESLVKVSYSTEKKDLISEELEPTMDFRTLDHRFFRWSSGAMLMEAEAPGRILRGFNYTRTYFYVTSLPTEITTLIGSVNNIARSSTALGLTFAPETLLYNAPSVSRTIAASGAETFTVKIRLSYKPSGWNTFWRAESQSYERIHLIANGAVYNNFPLANFGPILTLPQAT